MKRVPIRVEPFSTLLEARRKGPIFPVIEGPEKFHRFVVIEFPSFEKAVACHESAEYLEAAAHRKKDCASELEIVIVESI
jgi:uncharacterized protein (DUF1330 family)